MDRGAHNMNKGKEIAFTVTEYKERDISLIPKGARDSSEQIGSLRLGLRNFYGFFLNRSFAKGVRDFWE